ncbi:MAG: flagellin [Oscillospiraceae bacterium]|nr:flagellin [Oscillospiraceae bacterium]
MRINNNIMAVNSHRQYGINAGRLGNSVERLSSGFRVNRAADDAAGLAISEKMRTQIRGLNQASRNAQDGISLVQTAEGAMQSAHSIMQRMRELAVQSANGTNDGDGGIDRNALQLEFKNLIDELGDIERTVKFNNMEVFGPGETDAKGVDQGLVFTLQSGANMGDTTSFSIGRLNNVGHVGSSAAATAAIDTQAAASAAIATLDAAINTLSMARANLGAIQNRLEFKIQNLDNTAENLQAAESRIRDVDMAQQMTAFTRDNILFQASTAMLAQANTLPQGVLQLLA